MSEEPFSPVAGRRQWRPGKHQRNTEQKARWLAPGAIAALLLSSGCGEPGAPQPPSLDLPVPVRTLAAARTGNTVHLTWTTIDTTTDHTTPEGPISTHICRMLANGPCDEIASERQKLGVAASFDDHLPDALTNGTPAVLTYFVELQNHGRKSAGRSNAALSISGAAPPALADLGVSTRAEGVVLHWSAAPGAECEHCVVRIERHLVAPAGLPAGSPAGGAAMTSAPKAGANKSRASKTLNPLAASAPSADQVLQVAADGSEAANEALDRSVTLGATYEYRARRVEVAQAGSQEIEVAGPQSPPVRVETKDLFPPGVPQELVAVADEGSKAIDLSWSPDSEPDLSGYIVYRRNAAASSGEVQRISGGALLTTATYHDVQISVGTKYAYSVSAVDQAGNESARSAEAEETLTAPQ